MVQLVGARGLDSRAVSYIAGQPGTAGKRPASARRLERVVRWGGRPGAGGRFACLSCGFLVLRGVELTKKCGLLRCGWGGLRACGFRFREGAAALTPSVRAGRVDDHVKLEGGSVGVTQ